MGIVEKLEDLEVWQLARSICRIIDKLLKETPLGKNYALANQMERSSGSIMDNIAEGFGRGGNAEFHNFLSYSKGSTSELKSQCYRTKDKNLIKDTDFELLLTECRKLENKLGAFMFYLRKTNLKGIKFKKPDPDQKL